MTTVINNPGDGNNSGSDAGAGVVIGAVLVVLVLIVVLIYSLPYIRGQFNAMTNQKAPTIKVEIPVPSGIPTAQPSGTQ